MNSFTDRRAALRIRFAEAAINGALQTGVRNPRIVSRQAFELADEMLERMAADAMSDELKAIGDAVLPDGVYQTGIPEMPQVKVETVPAKTAEQRGQELIGMKGGSLPVMAVGFATYLTRRMGNCLEVVLSAYTAYAYLYEDLPITDELYRPDPDTRQWFEGAMKKKAIVIIE